MTRLERLKWAYPDANPKETALVILGDAGFNFYLSKTDTKLKQNVQSTGYTIYCLRGNHEERPENIATYHKVFDNEVAGYVYIEDEFPNIRFLVDGAEYCFGGYTCLAIGGAYSVDKHYRLLRAGLTEETNNPKVSGWFCGELLTEGEMEKITNSLKENYYFIISHCAPRTFEPTDLFLPFIDQSTVNKSMEDFLDKVAGATNWSYWLFGHYHRDRQERDNVLQMYEHIYSLDEIIRLLS